MPQQPDKSVLEKLVKDKIKLIESGPNTFYNKVSAEQKRILKEVTELIGDLDTKNGVIQQTQRNLDAIDKIEKKLKKSFYASGYIDAADILVGDLDKVKSLTNDYFKKGFGSIKEATLKKANLLYGNNKKQFLQSLIGVTETQVNLFNPIKTNILDAVNNGTTFRELVKNLSTTVVGDEKTEGKLQKYAKQIAGDTFSATERNYTKTISEALSIQFYRYVGGELPDTRCFCEERNGQYYHIEEIKSWGRLENIGDCNIGGGWAGMIKGTNENNIMTFLGGYNCKHSLIPVSLVLVPMSVINRAIEQGWFKPTDAEKQLLDL